MHNLATPPAKADAMAPDGSLMLGAGETVIGQTQRFWADPDSRGLYRRLEQGEAPPVALRA